MGKVEKAQFKTLVARVRIIDEEAAEYLLALEAEYTKNYSTHVGFYYSNILSSVMYWSHTPQGHAYWLNIDHQLEVTV